MTDPSPAVLMAKLEGKVRCNVTAFPISLMGRSLPIYSALAPINVRFACNSYLKSGPPHPRRAAFQVVGTSVRL
jgi:hypothetical protein